MIALVSALAWAADPPLPALPPPATPAPETPPAETPETPPADAPLPAYEALHHAIQVLADGDYDEALRISIPAISQYPEYASSFRAIADVAADQLEKQRTGTLPARVEYAPVTQLGLPRQYGYRPPPRVPQHKIKLGAGFEIGMPTGFRVDLDLDAKKAGGVDAIGVRFGGNTVLYNRLWPVSELTWYMDFRVNENWQIEANFGSFTYFGYLYPHGGAAAQYDPDGPLLVNLGARMAPEGSWMPDVTAGFVW